MTPKRCLLMIGLLLLAVVPCAGLFLLPMSTAMRLLPSVVTMSLGAVLAAVVQYSVNLSGGGVSINQTVSREADHPNPYSATLPIAKSGSLTTRTDDNTGVITSSTHGYTDADTVDVYWVGGYRYAMSITSYDANTITVDGGAGTNLPAQSTAVIVCKRTRINTAIDADMSEIMAFSSVRASDADTTVTRSILAFYDATDALVGSVIVLAGKSPTVIDVHGGATNSLTGNPITYCKATHEGTAETAALTIFSLEDATP